MAALGNAAVLGGRGMLGTDLVEACRKSGAFGEVLAADLPEVDITDEGSLRRALAGLKPKVIFNCAAMTDVDGCESKRDLAFALNATAAGTVAAVAALKAANMSDTVRVVGFDNISAVQELVKSGKVLATADQHADKLAVFGIEYALEMLRAKGTPADRETPVDLITATSVPAP